MAAPENTDHMSSGASTFTTTPEAFENWNATTASFPMAEPSFLEPNVSTIPSVRFNELGGLPSTFELPSNSDHGDGAVVTIHSFPTSHRAHTPSSQVSEEFPLEGPYHP
jgi:hypothetical protein